MGKYFGTDGIRGKAELFSAEFIQLVAKGLVQNIDSMDIKVLLGGDTRESTEWILRDFEKSLETLGVDYGNVGVLPTPAINEVFYRMGFDYAIDITASHNPSEDNGIKIFERGEKYGIKLNEKSRDIIERTIDENLGYELIETEVREDLHEEAMDIYLEHLRNYVGEVSFEGLKIGLDCANGATSVIGGKIFEELGAEVVIINQDENYGHKINLEAGSTHPEKLQELVKNNGLDFGAAFDGDGDRCILVDHSGNIVDGDQIIAILAEYFGLSEIAVSVMANQGLLEWAKENNIHVEITPVGDQYIAEKMREKNIKIGGEQSGHIILPNCSMGDGILTALMIAKVITESKKSLAELASKVQKFPQVIHNMPTTKEEKEKLANNAKIQELLSEYEGILAKIGGRLLVRPSGTEDLVRITMWGKDEKEIISLASELENKIKEIL